MNKVILFFLILLSGNAWGETNVPEYFLDLYNRHSIIFNQKINNTYIEMCEELELKKDSGLNKRQYSQILFLHELFTGKYCINFTSGGVFEIPYVFHWITPNPRYEIVTLPDRVKLASVSPDFEFRRYKTFADIDRIPSLFFGDLFSAKPKYYHPECGKFYTFGWCSEREMAYNALLALLGYTCKIKQEGVHTWSEIWLTFEKPDGSLSIVILLVDNSVDIVQWKKVKGINKERWLRDYGKGTQINWYNRIARSENQLKKLKDMKVDDKQIQWIEKRVKKWLGL